MSTNFYANMEIAPNVNYKMHIGKRVNNNGIAIFSGRHFASVAAWEEFLRFNEHFVKITDEYGVDYNVERFITSEFRVPGASDDQIKWLRGNQSAFVGIADEPQKNPQATQNWIDKETGSVFCKGEFF